MPQDWAKKLSSILATFVLIPASSAGTLVSSNEIVSSRPLTNITVNYDGKISSFRTGAETIEKALSQAKIEFEQYDAIDPSLDFELEGKDISVSISRALPVLIVDDYISKKTFSGYEETKDILKQHSIEVDKEDKIESSLIVDFTKEGWIGKKIQITRAPKASIEVDGSLVQIKTWEKTVKDLLEEKEIILGDKDKTNPPLDFLITNEMSIEIIRVAESVVKKQTSVLRKTVYENDYDLFRGQTRVSEEGSDGLKEQTFKVTFENGKIVSQQLISENVIKEPTNRVVKRGIRTKRAVDNSNDCYIAATKYFPQSEWANVRAVITEESGGNKFAISPTDDHGCFQIHKGLAFYGEQIYDPEYNAYVAFNMWKRRGWNPWYCCRWLWR